MIHSLKEYFSTVEFFQALKR